MAACPICGLESAGAVLRCPACNADLANPRASMDDLLGAAAPPRPSPSPKAKPARQPWTSYIPVVRAALLWGWASAAILAVLLGVLLHLFIGEVGSYTALKAGLNFGALIGFLIGSIWGVMSVLEPELDKGALIGAVVGAADTTLHYIGESIVIAQPDRPAYLYTLMGCAAGAVAGAFSVALRNFRDNG